MDIKKIQEAINKLGNVEVLQQSEVPPGLHSEEGRITIHFRIAKGASREAQEANAKLWEDVQCGFFLQFLADADDVPVQVHLCTQRIFLKERGTVGKVQCLSFSATAIAQARILSALQHVASLMAQQAQPTIPKEGLPVALAGGTTGRDRGIRSKPGAKATDAGSGGPQADGKPLRSLHES